MNNQRGQAFVEGAIVVVILSAMAYVGLRLMPSSLGGFYRHLCAQRAGISGMLP